MAKRRRLTPAQPGYLEAEPPRPSTPGPAALAAPGPAPTAMAPPIAQVSGDAAARAALEELATEMATARAQGLMLERLPLGAIEAGHLVRDRMAQDEDEMEALMASLEARGQQTPIEVVRLPAPQGDKAYGLISGWRRLTALNRLYDRTSDSRFGFVRALVIAPESASDAYVAMVEENEIRVNLSFYERARIAARAVEEGVYPDARAALRALYGSVTRSKRSKIGSFMGLVEKLDPVLRHPTAISEKLGLALVKALEAEEGLAGRLEQALIAAAPESPAEEIAILSEAVAKPAPVAVDPPAVEADPAPAPAPAPPTSASPARPRSGEQPMAGGRISQPAGPGVRLSFTADRNRIELTGPAVDAALMEALRDWLRQR
ncbi:ParB/RepB/Spo0J family partition protein [Pseudodonghicola flavimaris]|uniref:ParB N-terminal domain-containing protein n=1 Tax=Pseudodonghicola flavimaris TaxID=3050036 RepID=A0ABT7F869_9RHOB|nr:ParB N-terminal domain-containing protein [Pseudodonghicola flavimaris]MDK3020796.1 ParB N-terminal domain-containing protein [Pseudodonghicola flavimaris]